jgi:hypothetical protein
MLKAISMPVPVSPIVGPGLTGRPSLFASNAHRAAGGLRDRVERQPLSNGLPSPNPLTWA